MKSLVWLLAAVLAPLGSFALTNDDIIKMKKAGLSDDTILLAMQKEPGDYDTSTDALIELKEAEVSETIIKRMLGGSGPAPTASAAAPASSTSTPEDVFLGDYPSIAPPPVEIVTGGEYFTRYTLFQEDDEYSTTNYTRGSLVPINTPVKVVSISKDKLALKRLDTGDKLTVNNAEKHTRKNAAEFAQLMLSGVPTPLEQLPPRVASAIKNGEMRKGMTREQVLMARGYPPAHETPSLDRDRWVYWSSRFVRHTVVFFDGRLSEGRGIY